MFPTMVEASAVGSLDGPELSLHLGELLRRT
jgi:hypothetical protein